VETGIEDEDENEDEDEQESFGKPFLSLFKIVEGFDDHATVQCDGFTESLWVKHGFFKDVGKGRAAGYSPILIALDHFRREAAIVESLDDFGLTGKRPAINEYFPAFLKGNSVQDFQKGPFCLFQ